MPGGRRAIAKERRRRTSPLLGGRTIRKHPKMPAAQGAEGCEHQGGVETLLVK